MEKEIVGFENYTVNDSGNNEKTIFNKIIHKFKKPQRYKNGYLYVSLYNNGENKIFLLHRLIAEAFIPNIDNKPCIDHINTIKDDNRVQNLRWCTPQENMLNPITRKRLSDGRKGIKFSEDTKQKMSEIGKAKTGKLNNFYGHKHTEEFKKKSSERMKETLKNQSVKEALIEASKKAHRKSFKQCDQIDRVTGEVIKTWNDYDEFTASDFNRKCVRRCCKGERPYYKGFIWKYI